MKTLLLAPVVAALLAGCAVVQTGDQTWYKEGATHEEQQAALAAAQIQSKQAQVQPTEERGIFLQAMTAQGWRLMPKGAAPPLAAKPNRPPPPPPRTGTTVL